MERFGTDRPDTRFGMELENISDILVNTGFKVFRTVMEKGGIVKVINVKNAASDFSRKAVDELSDYVTEHGAKGLAWIKITEDSWQSPIGKFFSNAEK